MTTDEIRSRVLVTPHQLYERHRRGEEVTVLAVQSINPYTGRPSFTGQRIPGAIDTEAYEDFQSPASAQEGQRPLPKIEALQARARAWGLLAERPAAFIGADYPGFNLGLEEQLRAAGIPTVHFVGPQIWAWRGGRIKKIRRAVSHMLVIFPFEEEIYQKAGVPVTYIGHPLAETIPLVPDVLAARRQLGLPENARVVTVMPGSRMSEIKYLTEPYVRTVQLLAARDPSVRFIAPMAGERQKAYFMELVAKAGLPNLLNEMPLQLVDGESHACIAAADAVLAASGTATLEVALYKKPMVIAYKVLQAEWLLIRNMGYLPWIGLPNILARDFVVPEFLQHAATPEALAEAVWFQLTDENNRVRLQQRFTEMHHSLLRDSARESARAVLEVIDKA